MQQISVPFRVVWLFLAMCNLQVLLPFARRDYAAEHANGLVIEDMLPTEFTLQYILNAIEKDMQRVWQNALCFKSRTGVRCILQLVM